MLIQYSVGHVIESRRKTMGDAVENIDRLKAELDALRPLPSDVVGRIEQKLRIESNYHSNAIEGNNLTLGETRSLILHGLTAHGKSMRDHLDIEGHDEAVKAIETAVESKEELNEVFIRNLHRLLLKKPYEIDAQTPDGRPTKRLITIGNYKTQPNNVRTSTGEIYYFAAPDQVKPAMSDLMDWYRKAESQGEHPIAIAATFHYRFVRIHPFDDGNGRMARLLMNMILIRHGYTVAIVPIQERNRYIESLEQADKSEDLAEFVAYVAGCCEYTLNLHLRAARGEDIEDAEDIDKEIALFVKKSTSNTIDAREYADEVLYPFFIYCRNKVEQISSVFGRVEISADAFARRIDNQNLRFDLMEAEGPLPEEAYSVSTRANFRLSEYRGNQREGVFLDCTNEADPDDYLWDFSANFSTDGHASSNRFHEARYSGRELDRLKKIFNDMIRGMMQKLTQTADDSR